jgi:hypothetical protein
VSVIGGAVVGVVIDVLANAEVVPVYHVVTPPTT